MPLTIESLTIAQVPGCQWNSLLVSAVLFVFFTGLRIAEVSCIFVIFGIFQGRWFKTSVLKIFLMFFFPYHFWLIIDAHICNFGVNSIHISGFDYKSFELLALHVGWLLLVSWVTSSSHVPPHHIAAFILKYIIIKKSFNYFIFCGNIWFEKLNFSFKVSY